MSPLPLVCLRATPLSVVGTTVLEGLRVQFAFIQIRILVSLLGLELLCLGDRSEPGRASATAAHYGGPTPQETQEEA